MNSSRRRLYLQPLVASLLRSSATVLFLGEKVDFVQPLVTYDKNVETWMNELEHIMRRSVRQVLYKATLDYEGTPRVQWVQQHPGQAVLNGSQIHWTKDVENAITKRTLRNLLSKLNTQLMDLVRLERISMRFTGSWRIDVLVVVPVWRRRR